jgi:coenzyme F420 hydrogenase subunit beta
MNEEMTVLDNITEVVEDGLCTGCGTCAGVCPTGAVTMRVLNGLLLPEVKEDECISCRLCLKCCPGYSVDFEKLNSEVFGKQPEDFLIGNFLGCYLGHSTDDEVRRNSSSGGIASQLLIYALEKGLIHGALVVRMRKDRPLEPEGFIARTREEIISASKSKYCPVALNVALKEILAEEGKFAVVGLPCHIHGIRKAELNVKGLRERIVLHIGLFCSHTVNFFGTQHLLKKFGLSSECVDEVHYRGLGWPGSMLIKLKHGTSLSIPYTGKWKAYWPIFSCFFFTPMRCLMCPDITNELADISLGDAWLRELRHEANGESIIVTRTLKGEELLQYTSSEGIIHLKRVESWKVKRSQADPLKLKKEDFNARLAIIAARGSKIPVFSQKGNYDNDSGAFFRVARNLFVLSNSEASEAKTLAKLLIHIPLPVFRLYYGFYKILLRI